MSPLLTRRRVVEFTNAALSALTNHIGGTGETSAQIRDRVVAARRIQPARFKAKPAQRKKGGFGLWAGKQPKPGTHPKRASKKSMKNNPDYGLTPFHRLEIPTRLPRGCRRISFTFR
jgi:hypothetical protein